MSSRSEWKKTVASLRPPEALAPQARAIGSTVVAKSLRDALEADTFILAVPFGEYREIAKALPNVREYIDTQALARASLMDASGLT